MSSAGPRRGWSPRCHAARLATSAGLAGSALVLFPSWAFAAGEQIWTALYRMIGWLQAILVPLSVLAFIIGIIILVFDREKGRDIMVAAVVGLILAFLAWPIMDLAASFAR